jgi:isopentenyl diphosphate isomerase/L-lactate dehydrogenase-like FMN-dependent dehydrogenase
MRISRRYAIRQVAAMFAASPLSFAQPKSPRPPDDPVMEPATVMDFAPLAKAKLDPIAWDYLEGGGEDEFSLRDNIEGFHRIVIRPRAFVDVHKIDLSTTFLGQKLAYPILLDPAGGKNCFHADGENVVARGAAAAKAIHISNGGIEKTLATGNGPVWMHVNTGNRIANTTQIKEYTKELLDKGCMGICLTTDIMYASHRDRNIHNKFERHWCEIGLPKRDASGKIPAEQVPERAGIYPSRPRPTPTWPTLAELASASTLPVMVKGILTAEDAERCVKYGAKAIVVSNHGGRQLDHVGGTIEALPEVVQAVSGRIPVLLDGGVRRGTDILKALALGATACCIARPYLYGMTAFGQPGVERVIELLRTELALDMALAGTPDIKSIDRSLVRIRGPRA